MSWSNLRLGDISSFKAGNGFPKEFQGKTVGNLPFVKVSDMNRPGNELSLFSAENWLDLAEAKRMKVSVHEPGSIAFAKIGVALTYNRRRRIVRPTILDNNMMSARPRQSYVESSYFYYLMSTIDFNEISSGSALPYLTVGNLNQIEVRIPPLSEQEAIAAVLGALDDKIEMNRRTCATLEAMARALFRSWFVDFDPVHARAAGEAPAHMDPATAALFPDRLSEDGLPEGWRMGTLGSVGEAPRVGVDPATVAPETPYLGLEHMPRRSIVLDAWDHAGGVGSQKSMICSGDFLFGKLRPYFHKVGIAPVDGVCSTEIVVVRPKRPEWAAFVLAVISSDEFVDHTNASSAGTRMPRTNWRDMSAYPVALPPNALAAAFEKLAAPFRAEILAKVHENRTLAALRDALMPKLMSGELRVREAKARVGEVA